ncbi:hypothetical protein I316_00247 [Kwoniella heveanensis BCC8398]|uniref:Peptidase A1 domain-containing protein n=1 Tax=Kwoniella heveanensis BCC8398 TaxID=1296120 RepID=A0A1B9H427_9TREE|nr:hypothetical protein I316_00247 [Kwoniella heveanensis BCC8398]
MVSSPSSRCIALTSLFLTWLALAPSSEAAVRLPMARIDNPGSGVTGSGDNSGASASGIVQALLVDRRRSPDAVAEGAEKHEPRYLPNDALVRRTHDGPEDRAIKLTLKPHAQGGDANPARGDLDRRQDQSATAATVSQTSSISYTSTELSSTATTGAAGGDYQSNMNASSATDRASSAVWGVDPKSTLGATGTIEADGPAETMAVNGVTGAGIIYTIDITVDEATLPVHVKFGGFSPEIIDHRADLGERSTVLIDLIFLYSLTHPAKGAVAGCLVNTSVTLGEDTLAQYSVLAVTQVTADITNNAEYYSGRIGLAGSNLTIDKGPTVISALYEQGHIQTPVVGFYLPHRDEAWDSEISFGDPETSEHADLQHQVTLPSVGDPDEHYIVRFDQFLINNQTVSGSNIAYIDTGFSGLGVALSLHDHVLQQIHVNYTKEDSGVSVPCYPVYEWPTLTFQFGTDSQRFDIDYRDMITHPDDDPDGKCWSLIFGMPEDYKGLETPWVLGDTFLHNVYHSVNVETGEVKIFGLKDEVTS